MKHDLYPREDTLGHCKVCNGAEGTMPTDCPGLELSKVEQALIWRGIIDYRDSQWVILEKDAWHEIDELRNI